MTSVDAHPQTYVLMMAYLYPPLFNTGTTRAIKFVKYLPAFGYKPVILTTASYGTLPNDSEARVFRANDPLDMVKSTYRLLAKKKISNQPDLKDRVLPPDSRLEKLKSALLAPDGKISWYPAAVNLGRKLLDSYPVQLLFSTSSPETNHLVALKLKQKTGLPWVADFRDGWMFEPLISTRHASIFRRRLDARLERKVVLAADRVTTVNRVIAQDLTHRYPQAAGKIVVIPNGYDPQDFDGLNRTGKNCEKFRVVHTGALWLSRKGTSIAGLLQALKILDSNRHPIAKVLEIVMIGNLTHSEIENIGQSGVKRFFSLQKPVPYRQALQHQMDADVLLLITSPHDVGVSTTKLYEYLATGRPILALAGQSAAGELVKEMEAGLVVDPDDPAQIQEALQNLYEQWQRGQLQTKINPKVQQFSRRELAGKLAALFDELVEAT